MNRTIKFRGKRRDNGEWVYGNLLTDSERGKGRLWIIHYHNVEPFDEDSGYHFHGVDPSTVGQFTGLYDKDGKEIYEGDVARTNVVETIDEPTVYGMVGVVSISLYELEYGDYRAICCETPLIIGNIHDNPELVEQ